MNIFKGPLKFSSAETKITLGNLEYWLLLTSNRAEEDSKKWEAYLTFIDNLVIDGLLQTVAASLGFFLDETDPALTQGVLLEVKNTQQLLKVFTTIPSLKIVVQNSVGSLQNRKKLLNIMVLIIEANPWITNSK